MILAAVLAWQGRPEEAEPWAQRAECTVRAEADPAAALAVHYIRGRVELARGRDADALAAFRAAERLDGLLDNSHLLITRTRAFVLTTLSRPTCTSSTRSSARTGGPKPSSAPALGLLAPSARRS
jgi:LuxR family transcriptional regulator, maltose regulon positive regulatory protein